MVHERRSGEIRREECPFCNPPPDEVVLAGTLCYARWDKYPVSRGHLLIIPFRHVASFFDTTQAEQQELLALAIKAREQIEALHQPDGYNFGANIGAVAGQSVMHVHFHLIPRYAGDTDHPRGGIRRVISG
jgi:diadenosine tetraphosphate (Ap4A) HIT family hydrolase